MAYHLSAIAPYKKEAHVASEESLINLVKRARQHVLRENNPNMRIVIRNSDKKVLLNESVSDLLLGGLGAALRNEGNL